MHPNLCLLSHGCLKVRLQQYLICPFLYILQQFHQDDICIEHLDFLEWLDQLKKCEL